MRDFHSIYYQLWLIERYIYLVCYYTWDKILILGLELLLEVLFYKFKYGTMVEGKEKYLEVQEGWFVPAGCIKIIIFPIC